MSHKITFECDECNQQFISEPIMDMPPYWFGVQICLANQHGTIPDHEQEIITHFCSKQCLHKYLNGEDMKRRVAIVDKGD